MTQPGRKTAEAISALSWIGPPPRLTAPPELTETERRVFADIVGACDRSISAPRPSDRLLPCCGSGAAGRPRICQSAGSGEPNQRVVHRPRQRAQVDDCPVAPVATVPAADSLSLVLDRSDEMALVFVYLAYVLSHGISRHLLPYFDFGVG
jgi:hypothetical protein